MDLLGSFKYGLMLLLLLSTEVDSEVVSCISCVWSRGGPDSREHPCYKTPANTTSIRCAHSRYYCQTVVVHYGGGRLVIQRGCADPEQDVRVSTNQIPQHTSCNVNRNPTTNRLEARCYYSCKSNNCNNVTLDQFPSCPGDCSIQNNAGQCDFESGRCVCKRGYSGPNCEIYSKTATRLCVQCNEKLDPNCRHSTEAIRCPADMDTYKYCTSTKTTLFDKDQNLVNSYVSRGCSTSFNVADQCKFLSHANSLRQDAIEYICSSTCDHDGCNTNIPDGRLNNQETKNLHCHVCESDDDTSECAIGNMARTRCPSHTHYCKSIVTYFISNKNDLNYRAEPEYKFGKIIRKCGGHRIVSKCSDHRLGSSSGKKMKCEETCNTDGCNTGWPHRPSCSQCSGTYDHDGFSSCLSSPQWPSQCAKPYQNFCVTINRNIKNTEDQFVFKREIERNCSYHDLGQTCRNETFGAVEVETCNSTCGETACNFKGFRPTNGSGLFAMNLNLLVIVTSVALRFMMECF